jgi:hypothetical protein
MRNAETILDITQNRGSGELPLEDVYRQLYNPTLHLMAYGKLYRNAGAMTPGATSETVDGMSLVLLCYNLREQSSMNRSVVTHHWTAWWRSHRATSRWIAGNVRRRRSGRGGKRIAGATAPSRSAPLAQLQPHQKAIGQHRRDRVAMEAGPQAALVLVPAALALGLLMALLDRVAAMGIGGQLLDGSRRRQVAPVAFPFFRLASRRALS